MSSALGLSGRALAVIGAGQGIGRATALLLAAEGANVALVDEVEERARAVAREVQAHGVAAVPLAADVTDPRAADDVIGRAFEGLGGALAGVINIVGSASWAPLAEMDEATWRRDFRVNLDQHWYIARAAAARWRGADAPGSLVAVASVSGVFASPRHGAYGA